MRTRIMVAVATVAGLSAAGLSAAQAGSRTGGLQQLQILSSEPPIGGMHMNQVVFVDDHTCPAGQLKMVAAPEVYNGPTRRSCVPR